MEATGTDLGSEASGGETVLAKLFVGGLSWQTSQERLREYFTQFGEIDDVLIMKDPITQRSRGFGFITFRSPSSVTRVLSASSHLLDGKAIDPKPATPKNRSRESKTKKIFVGGVSQETATDEVREYFRQFGNVEDAVMLMDQQTRRHRGFGFVTFEQEDSVDRVCDIHFHTIKNKKVECKRAQPKELVQAGSSAALLGKRLLLNNLGQLPALGLSPALQSFTSGAGLLQAAIQQQFALQCLPNQQGKMVTNMATHRYSPYSLPPNHTTSTSSNLQPASYTPSSLIPSNQAIGNNIQPSMEVPQLPLDWTSLPSGLTNNLGQLSNVGQLPNGLNHYPLQSLHCPLTYTL